MDASDRRGQQGSEPAARSRSPGPPAAAARPLVTLEPAPAGADALIDHLPHEVLAMVFCFVDAKTLIVAVPSVSLA